MQCRSGLAGTGELTGIMRKEVIRRNRSGIRIWLYRSFKITLPVLAGVFMLTGCAGSYSAEMEDSSDNRREVLEEIKAGETGTETIEAKETDKAETGSGNILPVETTEDGSRDIRTESEIVEDDWSDYFNGLNGAAVLYDSSANRYTIYNSELASTRRSPCSTFKIISSLIALENGIIVPEDLPEHGVVRYSGTKTGTGILISEKLSALPAYGITGRL